MIYNTSAGETYNVQNLNMEIWLLDFNFIGCFDFCCYIELSFCSDNRESQKIQLTLIIIEFRDLSYLSLLKLPAIYFGVKAVTFLSDTKYTTHLFFLFRNECNCVEHFLMHCFRKWA